MEIRVEGLGRKFPGKQWALQDVSFSLNPGIACVLGENGAGKSTLLKVLASQILPSTGQVFFGDRLLRQAAISLRRKSMFIEEPKRLVLPPLQFLTRMASDYNFTHPGAEDLFVDAMKRFEVLELLDKRLSECSKGQRARVALAGLIAVAPPIWLLDEPFAWGLDAHGVQQLEKAMREHGKNGGVVLFTSQWPQHARQLADWTIILHHGKLAAAGATKELKFETLAEESDLRAIQTAFAQGSLANNTQVEE